MLTPRSEAILKSIIDWYIEHAVPVSSQSLVKDYGLGVSSATVRNEMACLEQEGYIIRPHTSAGSIPSDKGYRFYVTALDQISLPVSEQRMITHLFHQVEGKLDEWLSLAASIILRLSQNTAVITVPRPADCQFRHMELVSIQDTLVLLVLVLRGARIKQEIFSTEVPVTQARLTEISARMNQAYVGLTGSQIRDGDLELTDFEKQVKGILVKIVQTEDEQGYAQSYLEGLHFMLNQPEFSHNQRVLAIMELLEHRAMLGSILPPSQDTRQVRVVIGSENKNEVAQDCSLVIGRYGLPDEASGTILVVGPTRMAYPRVISAVSYLSILLSGLVAELYGVNSAPRAQGDNTN
ncbi:MAG: heat-inducible transcriptional repressor HrcA [Dehalococcoidales bacterium]|nr:heat-inducible transcriptional repressor HrcA [Dehalococcoidales bacterium]